MMEWQKILPKKLPQGEVLAANFRPYTYGYKEILVGRLYKDGENIICEDENTQLEGCTHYIQIHDFDLEDI